MTSTAMDNHHLLMGKSTIPMVILHSKLFVMTRLGKPHQIPWKNHHFPMVFLWFSTISSVNSLPNPSFSPSIRWISASTPGARGPLSFRLKWLATWIPGTRRAAWAIPSLVGGRDSYPSEKDEDSSIGMRKFPRDGKHKTCSKPPTSSGCGYNTLTLKPWP